MADQVLIRESELGFPRALLGYDGDGNPYKIVGDYGEEPVYVGFLCNGDGTDTKLMPEGFDPNLIYNVVGTNSCLVFCAVPVGSDVTESFDSEDLEAVETCYADPCGTTTDPPGPCPVSNGLPGWGATFGVVFTWPPSCPSVPELTPGAELGPTGDGRWAWSDPSAEATDMEIYCEGDWFYLRYTDTEACITGVTFIWKKIRDANNPPQYGDWTFVSSTEGPCCGDVSPPIATIGDAF